MGIRRRAPGAGDPDDVPGHRALDSGHRRAEPAPGGPPMTQTPDGRYDGGTAIRIAAVADLHCSKTNQGSLLPIFAAANERADVLLLCGDLTDYGYPEEARNLVAELAPVKIPIIAVLGNHDYESGHADEVKGILAERVRMLDGD